MTYNIGDKVFITAKIIQKVENEDGISYDIAQDDPKRSCYSTLRVKEKDILPRG